MAQLLRTADGSHTLYIPELDEHYHSIHGAVQESTFIFINNGLRFCETDPVSILEIGFGTGLNALLTAIDANSGFREVNYTAIEKNPVNTEIIESLNYPEYAGVNGPETFRLIHSAAWNTSLKINYNFNLKKIAADFTNYQLTGSYDLIYFDAFGPDKQPEMWTSELFSGIAAVTNKNGILVTYSAKGEVKRSLRACGFDVALLPGPPGKRQMIRAVKI